MAIDPDALASSLRRLATLGQPGSSVVDGLRHVTEACVDLFGVSGSGIMLADEQNIPRYVAAISETDPPTGSGKVSSCAACSLRRKPSRKVRKAHGDRRIVAQSPI